MDDSIINIDDESDSFSLSSDTDIRNIVDQWKHNHTSATESKDLKHFDTRTFTRPKKKLFTSPDVNNYFSERKASTDELPEEQATTSSGSVPVPKIDLKIGGLVTSMQHSLLGDMSPPSNMDNSMGNSLITSNDFSNIDFINDTGDSLSMAHFKQYRLSDVTKDRNFLERLTNYDESLFTKDADINNVDLIENGNCTGSSTSTLQNSTDSTSNLGKNDGTFIAADAANGTFVAQGAEIANGTFEAVGEVDRTFIQAPNSLNGSMAKNSTFELGTKCNETFEAQPKVNVTQVKVPFSLEDEELSLCDSFNATKTIEYKRPDGIKNASNSFLGDVSLPQIDMNSTFQLDEYQSTPAAQKSRKSRKSESLSTISPIFSENRKLNNQSQNVDKFVDIEIEDLSVMLRESAPKNASRASNITGIDVEFRERERQSLAKFEEFENTLLILENNKNEEEFDDLLNSLSANIRSPLSQKVRQSLDNIKKRHSFIGTEKQQQDELNREKAMNTPKSGKYSEFGSSEKNRLNESMGRSAMISSTNSIGSGSGERLLRRSRLFDDVIASTTDRIDDNGAHVDSGTSVSFTDNKETNELNSTQTLNRKNQIHLETESSTKTDTAYNTEETNTETKPNNRDRFKTIRIFKRPPENAIQIPDPEETFVQGVQTPISVTRGADVFATKNRNSPQQQTANEEANQAKPINTMTFKKSGLARPRQLSGLVKRDMYTKSNSQEMLSSDEHISKFQPKQVSQIKSPMGIKSKSIHNLSTARSVSKLPTSRAEAADYEQPSSTRNSTLSSGTFKVPAQKSLATMRQRSDAGQARKLSLIRPSSGYYGYNSKRTDSDTDLGRFSSRDSLSSGSSKSSLSRGETPETFVPPNENVNATFVQGAAKQPNVPSRPVAANGGSGIAQPKISLLRPPNRIRSALPRPSTTITKR